MRNLNLDNKQAEEVGTDIPGTISLYIVRAANGEYVTAERRLTNNWVLAELHYGFQGLSVAKEIAKSFGGDVCITSCTPVKKYVGGHELLGR